MTDYTVSIQPPDTLLTVDLGDGNLPFIAEYPKSTLNITVDPNPVLPSVYAVRYIVGEPSITWVIQHNRGTTFLHIQLYRWDGVRMLAGITYQDSNTFTVHLTEALSGYVDILFSSSSTMEVLYV